MYRDYNDRLMDYIIEQVRENKVPPSLDSMLDNVSGVQSKSTLHNRLQALVKEGVLVQKNKKGYYYPTCFENETNDYLVSQGKRIGDEDICRTLCACESCITESKDCALHRMVKALLKEKQAS